MIRFSLECNAGHTFEGWFPSGAAYDKQAKRKLVTCAVCGSAEVHKAIMAPRIAGTRQNKQSDVAPARRGRSKTAPAKGELMVSELPDRQKEMLATIRKLRREVEANAEFVGPRFAEEARKIHNEEVPARGIYGEATIAEAKALHDDGIEVYPLPVLPEDKN